MSQGPGTAGRHARRGGLRVRYDAVLAETVGIRGVGDDLVEAYTARPLAPGPRGGVLVIHHMPVAVELGLDDARALLTALQATV